MEVEDFIKKNCLTHCLQQMEYIQGQDSEAPEHGGRSTKSETDQISIQGKLNSKISLLKRSA